MSTLTAIALSYLAIGLVAALHFATGATADKLLCVRPIARIVSGLYFAGLPLHEARKATRFGVGLITFLLWPIAVPVCLIDLRGLDAETAKLLGPPIPFSAEDMAPKHTTARLAEIDPEATARATDDAILERVHQMVASLSPRIVVTEDPSQLSRFAIVVRDMIAYAKGLHGQHDRALDAFETFGDRTVIGLVTAFREPDIDRLDAGNPMQCAVLAYAAARGRRALDRNETIPASWLAALAGVSADHVRLLVREGKLQAAAPTAAEALPPRRLVPALRGDPRPGPPPSHAMRITVDSAKAFLAERADAS